MFTDAVSARTKAHQRTAANWASVSHNIAKPNVVRSAFLEINLNNRLSVHHKKVLC
jgi:hypothetical protein